MLDPNEFRKYVIRPTLEHLELWSEAAELLLFGTALTESNLRWLRQKKSGPGLGFYQIEPVTHEDIWVSYLQKKRNKKLRANVQWLISRAPLEEQLMHNLSYATAIARVIYWRKPEAMPEAFDLEGLAKYWKDHYNTFLGSGKPETFVKKITQYL